MVKTVQVTPNVKNSEDGLIIKGLCHGCRVHFAHNATDATLFAMELSYDSSDKIRASWRTNMFEKPFG